MVMADFQAQSHLIKPALNIQYILCNASLSPSGGLQLHLQLCMESGLLHANNRRGNNDFSLFTIKLHVTQGASAGKPNLSKLDKKAAVRSVSLKQTFYEILMSHCSTNLPFPVLSHMQSTWVYLLPRGILREICCLPRHSPAPD